MKILKKELLEENNNVLTLSEIDYVFWMSQGCMFCFFRLNEGDNPPVYYYNEAGEDNSAKKEKVNLLIVWKDKVPLVKQLAQLKSICPSLNSKPNADLLD